MKIEDENEMPFSIELASQNEVNELQPQIERLLAALGHPEALVTDESTFLDFISFFEYPDSEMAEMALMRRLGDAGLELSPYVTDTLVKAARELKEQEESQ